MYRILFGLILCIPLLTGCLASNLAEVIKSAATDNATACVTITSIYGTGRLARTNISNGSVSCTQEGLTVKSGSTQ